MKAVAVFPGKADSVHLADLPEPSVDDIPNGRGVLVEALHVGLDGTDAEINAAEYGAAPEGYDFLVIGHESFGRVLEVGQNVRNLKPGAYVVATVRRPGGSIYDRIGHSDMTTDATYYERGISLLHGFLTERYLKKLCDRTFLSLWSYPNVYRDQGSSVKGDGKEVCDLLVVFEKHVIIFSDKDCVFPDSGDLTKDWSRWFRRAVQKSADQVWGAERWIRSHPDRLFVDRTCEHKFPILRRESLVTSSG